MISCLIVCVASHYLLRLLSPFKLVILPTVNAFVPSSISLYLLRRRKERGGKKAGGEALEVLEAQLRDRADTLGLSLEQKTKAMKQRDKTVTYVYTICNICIICCFVLRITNANHYCASVQYYVVFFHTIYIYLIVYIGFKDPP